MSETAVTLCYLLSNVTDSTLYSVGFIHFCARAGSCLSLVFQGVEAPLQDLEIVLELHDALDTRQVHTGLDEHHDPPHDDQIGIRVQSRVARGAAGVQQTLALVVAQSLRVDARQLRCHRNRVFGLGSPLHHFSTLGLTTFRHSQYIN